MTYEEADAILARCAEGICGVEGDRTCEVGRAKKNRRWVHNGCYNAYVVAHKEARKAELATRKLCEAECTRPATMTARVIGGDVDLCGRHLTKAQREHRRQMAGWGMLAAVAPPVTREALLKMASA